MDDFLDTFGDLEILLSGAGAAVFAISYAVFFAWRRTPAGRALMYFVLALIALCVTSVVEWFVGHDYPLREWIRGAVYAGILVTVWRLVIVLWHTWRHTTTQIPARPKQKEKK